MEITFNAKAITNILHRYHLILFAVVILGGLVIVVLSLNNIIISSSQAGSDYTPAGTTFQFDEDTMKQVDNLKSRDQAADTLDLSKGRSNPFVE
ncbi:MAG TPA: hypothetical protein VF281_01825 [Candidatus Saccharimonadales bacterium]